MRYSTRHPRQADTMNLQQYLLKATMLASRGQMDQAMATARQGLQAPVPPGAAQESGGGEFRMLQRMELQLLLADLLEACGHSGEAQATARQAREALLASGLDPDLTQPLLLLAEDILDRTGAQPGP